MEQKEGNIEDYAGIEQALREGYILKIHLMGGAGFAELNSCDRGSIKVQYYQNDFYVSEMLRQLSEKFLGKELVESKEQKESLLDQWIKDGNEIFGVKEGDKIRLEIRHHNKPLLPIPLRATFAHAYDILNQIPYTNYLKECLNFIDQARKLLRL